jgi:hypothetical protein
MRVFNWSNQASRQLLKKLGSAVVRANKIARKRFGVRAKTCWNSYVESDYDENHSSFHQQNQ